MNPDLVINREIRKILVRNYIDLGQLFIQTSRGVVRIRGSLDKLSGTGDRLTASSVGTVFTSAKRIKGVQHMVVDLKNWTFDGDSWRPSDESRDRKKMSLRAHTDTGHSFDISN